MAEEQTAPDERKLVDAAFSVDVIIPVFNERPEALVATLSACTKQTRPVNSIYVVDDCSSQPVTLPDWAKSFPYIKLTRLRENRGTAGARNAAISRSTAAFLACVNTEVFQTTIGSPPVWITSYSIQKSVPAIPELCLTEWTDSLTRWRMRFQEPRFGDQSGPSAFAHGHAAFFRKAAFEAVGGYNEHVGTIEDSEICERLWKIGWETHYIAQSRSISIQKIP